MYLDELAGRANLALACSGVNLADAGSGDATVEAFPDGETFVKINENVRRQDVFIIQPTSPPTNHNLMELMIMADALRRSSAARITAVIPYFGYARQDRRTKARTPISAKLVANLLTRAGIERIRTMDLHAAQIQGFFDVPVDHLYAAGTTDEYFRSLKIPPEDLVIVSPDEGSIKRSLKHVSNLGGQFAIVDKRRSSATETRQANIIGGPIEGKVALLFDDMISTAGSIVGAAQVAKDLGAREIYVSATHAVFCGPAIEKLSNAPITEVVVTNTLPITPERQFDNLRVVSIAPLLGEAIRRIHRAESVSGLFS